MKVFMDINDTLYKALKKEVTCCIENENYQSGIFVKTIKQKQDILNMLVEFDCFNFIEYTKNIVTLRLDNGSCFKIIILQDNFKAFRLNGIIIDETFNILIIRQQIMPMLCNYKNKRANFYAVDI